MTGTCARCRRRVDFEPAKCPYCTTVQPKRVFDPSRHRRLTVASAVFGALAGSVGMLLAPARVVHEFSYADYQRRGLENERLLHENWSKAKARLEAQGYAIADPKRLAIAPQPYLGKPLALTGYATFIEAREGSTRACIGTAWAGGQLFEVDVDRLEPAKRAMLLRASKEPSLFVVWGRWSELPSQFRGLNSAEGLGLVAEGAERIGPARARGGAADVRELLGL